MTKNYTKELLKPKRLRGLQDQGAPRLPPKILPKPLIEQKERLKLAKLRNKKQSPQMKDKVQKIKDVQLGFEPPNDFTTILVLPKPLTIQTMKIFKLKNSYPTKRLSLPLKHLGPQRHLRGLQLKIV
jgi:hypothetical protein